MDIIELREFWSKFQDMLNASVAEGEPPVMSISINQTYYGITMTGILNNEILSDLLLGRDLEEATSSSFNIWITVQRDAEKRADEQGAKRQQNLGAFSLNAWGNREPEYEPGEWSVLMFNTTPRFVKNKPYIWKGFSQKAARKFLNGLVRYCTSYDGQFEKVSFYAYMAEDHWYHDGYCVMAMTKQNIGDDYRELRHDERPL